MNNQNGFDGSNIFGDEDILSQGLADSTKLVDAESNQNQSDRNFIDPLLNEPLNFTTTETSSSELGLSLFELSSQSIASEPDSSSNNDTFTGEVLAESESGNDFDYAIFAEGQLTLKGQSDFDGDPLIATDDAYIYAAEGFEFKSNQTLPILRDDLGEPILDESGNQQLLDNAVVVTDGYKKAKAKNNNLSGLIPPQTVDAQTLDIPVYADIVTTELDNRIPSGSQPVTFDAKANKIKNANDWNNKFPQGGTAENPTYVRVIEDKLEIPNNVDLNNYVIVVEKGDIKFKGSNNDLDNVVLLAEDGKLEAKKVNANNTTFLASDKIEIKSQSQFTGENLIANGSGKIEFKSKVTTPNETDSLRVISAEDLELKSQSEIRGQLLASEDLTVKSQSTFYGSIGAKNDIDFNSKVEVYGVPSEPETEITATIDSVTLDEGNGSGEPTTATLNVTLSESSTSPVSVDYATSDDTAIAGEDYTADSGTLTFASGETEKSIEIAIAGDNIDEGDEAFEVELSNPDGITLGNDKGTVNIIDDDNPPEIAIDSLNTNEASGTAEFTVSLNSASSFPVTVDFSTIDGSAVEESDYIANSGTVTFEPGETNKTIAVEIANDELYENAEAFTVELSNPNNASIAVAEAAVTIEDDDELPGVAVGDTTVAEGDDGTTTANFVLTLSAASGVEVSLDYATTDGSAVAGLDYVANSGTLTFAPGETSKTVSVTVNGDSLDEVNEAFSLNLSNIAGATLVDGEAIATIEDDDAPPELAVSSPSIEETDGEDTTATVTLTLSQASSKEITIDYATEDGLPSNGGTAVAGSDYTATNGTITFAPGETSKTIEVGVLGDILDEIDEAFTVNLDNPSNVTLGNSAATITITDNDALPAIEVANVTTEEGNENTTASFTLTLDNPSSKEITVDYTSVDASAIAGSDYTAQSGTITFAPGETSKTVDVEVLADILDESSEAFTLQLTNPSNATIETTEITATIEDSDEPPIAEIASISLNEGNEDTTNAELTVTLDNPSGKEITIDYATENDSAIAGSDYTATTGTITFEPGETSKTIAIPVTGDDVFEGDEAFKVNLSNPNNVVISEESGIATVTIANDDTPALGINFNLANDTGVDDTDKISSDATITGNIENIQENVSLSASMADGEAVDKSDLIQPDGSFTLGIEDLSEINGGDLGDGTYTLTLAVTNGGNNTVAERELTFTLDTAAPSLDLTVPLADGNHSNNPRLIGQVGEASATLGYSLDGSENADLTVNDTGNFDTNLGDELEAGTHNVTVTATDIAGNQSSQEVSFQVGDSFFTPEGTNGWGAVDESTLILGERDSYVVQTEVPVELGLDVNEEGEEVGTRTISFDLDAVWDKTNNKDIEDQLLVYLVDPANPSQTLLDNDSSGSAVFSVAGEQSDFTPGLVSFDGTTVTIDASSLTDIDQGLLVFQLLNQDNDTDSVVTVNNLTSTTDIEGFANPIFPQDNNAVAAGGELNLANLNENSDVETVIGNVSFDASTGEYKALVSITNNGEAAISRNSAIVFNNLPDGVELAEPSGTDESGNPYINLRPGIGSGGLGEGETSQPVEVIFTNPNLIRFGLDTTVLVGSSNVAPVFEPIDPLTVVPGEKLELNLAATDANGDNITYRLQSDDDLPTGMLSGNGVLKFNPKPNEIGSYEFIIIASDGVEEVSQTVTIDVVADPVTTTRISGVIENVQQEPLAGVPIELGELSTVTNADGSFVIETDQPLTDDTLKVRGEEIEGEEVYPFIAEKLPLVLGQSVYAGFNNTIDRPIYLPALDVDSGQEIDPTEDITVTTENIPGASVFVEAGSLSTQEEEAFTGTLSITEVPPDLTPAALPENLSPDLVVTIQPGEMLFDTPAPLNLPNTAGWAAGTEMDLWSINPETGDFDNVGTGIVSEDGSVIETIEGGIRNSSWHFFAPPPISPPNNNNPPPDCDECQETGNFKSEVELHSGAVIEDYDLVSYASNGESRGVSLTYDSLRADPRPIFQFSYSNINPNKIAPQFTNNLRLVADLTIDGNGFDYQLPGYQGEESPLIGEGKHFWSLPEQPGEIKMSLQADLRDWESGKYDFVLNNGIKLYIPELDIPLTNETIPPQILGSSLDYSDKILHVNTIDSPFGSGWGIDGWQEIIENNDGSVLLVDGDGSELWFEAPENEGEAYGNPPGDFTQFEKLPNGTFRRTTTDQMVYQFNLNNQLESTTDSNGNSTQYVYDNQQRLTTIVDPVGLETTFTYNVAGKVDTITDPGERITYLEYDREGNLVNITNPDDTTNSWSYDDEHHMIGEIDANNNQATASYDQFGRANRATTKDGSVVKVDPIQTQGLYNPEATASFFSAPAAYLETSTLTASYADENGRVIQTQLDTSGQRVAAIDGEGDTTRTERNSDNLISNQTDARGFETNYTYDERGNVVLISQEIDTIDDEPQPQPSFANSIRETENSHQAIVSGDFNNDGIIDLANPSSVLFGVGDGTFIEEYNDGISGSTIETEDLDNDGFLDLIITSSSSIRLRFNNGDGTFDDSSSSVYQAPEFIEAVAVEDFNNDGLLDVIAAGFNGNISLFENQNNRVFASSSNFELGERLDDLVAGDFNADGNVDLASALNPSKNINVLYGNGDGTFAEAIDFYTGSRKINSLATGDLNNDGISDLIATVQNSLNLTVFLGVENALFEAPVDYLGTDKSASNFTALDLGDFDNDGNLDLLSFNSLLESVSILSGLGDGTFDTPQQRNILPGASTDLAFGDFDSDGWLDIAASNTLVGGITLFSNQGDGDFRDNYQTVVTTNTTNLATGDFNNDEFADLVSVNYDRRTVSAYVGGGDGTFEFLEEYSLRNRPSAVNLADLNGDGFLDLVTASYSEVSVLIGNGDGSFDDEPQYYAPGTTTSASNRPQVIHTEDLNGDGVADLLLDYGNTKDFFSVLIGNGDGSFANAVVYDTERYLNLDLEDLDGDGSLDVVIGHWITNNFSVQYGNGDGSFADAVNYSLGTNTQDLDIGDVNNDGLMDIVLADRTSGPRWTQHETYILLNNGNRTFAQAIELDLGNTFGNADSIALIDLDRDENLDLITLYHNGISTALGNGKGIFTPDQRYTAGNEPQSFAIADLDLDELPDLLVLNSKNASWYDSYVSVLLNQSAGKTNSNFTTTEYTYDPIFNQVTSETDELGRQTLYDIDPNNGNLLSTTKVVGEVGGDDDVTTSYTYTDAGLIDTMTDPLGRVTDYDYDASGNVITETYAVDTADEASVSYEYDASGNQTAVIDENGNRTEFEYDGLNRLIKTTYAVGTTDESIETTEYDGNGNQVATVDGNGNRTEYEYDEKDRLIETISPDPDGDGELTSPISTSTYDSVGNLIATTDPLGRETRYVYDSRNRLVETILPDGTSRLSKYDRENNLTGTTDAAGETTRQVYDSRDRLIGEVDPQGNITRYEYDGANQLIAVVDGNGNRTEYQYDDLGRQIAVIDGEGNITRTEYDKAGNVVAIVDGNGNRTEYGFDERDRNTTVTDPENGTTTTEYDGVGNVLSITDPVNNQTSYTYDAQNRVIADTNELGFTRTFEYDDVGNSISTTDRNGRERELTYDGLNRQVEENWLNDADNFIRTTNSEYDAANQLIATDDPNSAYNFTYDELGRVVTVDNAGTPGVPNVVLTYNYDEEGNIISVSDTIDGVVGATTAYNYDELDRVEQITQSGENVADKRVDFAYDAIGQHISTTRYSDLQGTNLVADSSYTYDDANRLTNLNHSNNTTEIANYDLTYDAASRITQIVDADGTNDYSYDQRDQLTAADHSDESNADETYSYDENGNRISSSLHGDGYVTDVNNRLVSDGTYNYEYDNEGNLISQTEIATGKVQEMEWDYLNRLVAVIDKDSAGNETQNVEFTYDMFGKRLSKTVDGEATYFVYDRDNVILDFADADGIEGETEAELDQRYLHGERVDQVLAQENGAGDVNWHLADHLGSIRDLLDNNGNTVNHYVYDSFGNVVSQTGETVISRYLYTGRESDEEIGLQYNRARYYIPELGIFTNEDPIEFEAEDYNLYRYVENNPIYAIDPLGLYGLVVFQTRSISYEDNGIKQANNIQTVINAYQRNPDVEITSDTTYAYIWYAPVNTGSPANQRINPPGRRPILDDRGHIVGAQLGGSGNDPNNLFAQNAIFNQNAWRFYETSVRNYLDANGSNPACPLDLNYTVNLTYGKLPFNQRLRPVAVGGTARFSDGRFIPGFVFNP